MPLFIFWRCTFMANAGRKCFVVTLFRLPLRPLNMEWDFTHLTGLNEITAVLLIS